MDIDTYEGLKESIADWLMRSDLDTQIPKFITLAEARLNKRVRHRDMESTESLTLDSSGSAPLPSGYLEWRLLTVNTTPRAHPEFVEPDSREFLFRYRPYSVPQYFTILGDQIRVQPATEESATLIYYSKLSPLSDASPTNWLLERSPESYLYASLIEASAFLHSPEDVKATYVALFDNAVGELMQDSRAARVGREPPVPNPLAGKTEETVR